GQCADALVQRGEALAHESGNLPQNPLHLPPFVGLQRTNLVVQVETLRRFDVDGLAAGRAVLNEAFDLPPRLRSHGDDHAAVANGRLFLGRISFADRCPERALQRLPQVVFLSDDELPKARQFLRSGVFYTPVLVNGLADSLLQIRCLLNMRGEFPEARILLGSFVKVSPEETKRGKNPPDLHQ